MNEAFKNYRTVRVTSDNFNQTLKISSLLLFNAGVLKKNKSTLEFCEAFRRQDGNWFTNYDLILEYKQPNGNWSEIKRVETVNSNDELIEYKAIKSGLYRYVIKKISSFNFRNNIDDLIAVTHVVRDE